MHRAIRVASLFTLLIGLGIYGVRSQRTPEQEELRTYVEISLPLLASTETRIDQKMTQLGRVPGLPPEAARRLLVDDIIPNLLALRSQSNERKFQTLAVIGLQHAYDEVVLAQIEACRTSVRVIDNSKLDTETAMAKVKRAFADAGIKRAAWKTQLAQTCAAHGLVQPSAAN